MTQFIDESVTVAIRRVRQINDVDFGSEADFFSRVTIDGKVFNGKKFDERDNLLPGADWTFTNSVSAQVIGIKLEVFESDVGGATKIDINPLSGINDLNLAYDVLTGRLFNRDQNETLASSSGSIVIRRGNGGDRGEIEFSISGLAGLENQNTLLNQTFFTGEVAESGDGFGSFGTNGLAVGDYDRDGRDDLAIGTVEGPIHVIYGSSNGLNLLDQQSLTRVSLPPNSVRPKGRVASGHIADATGNTGPNGGIADDRKGKQFTDLMVAIDGTSSEGRDLDFTFDYLGSSIGFDFREANDSTLSPLSGFAAEPGHNYGAAMLIDDFNGDGTGDRVAGAPNAAIFGVRSGAVQVINAQDPTPTDPQRQRTFSISLERLRPGIQGNSEDGDLFGAALASADLDQDGFKDLVVGSPGAADGKDNVGNVHIIYGSADLFETGNSLDPIRDQLVLQPLGAVKDPGDRFGEALAVGDFDGNGVDDLVIGAPGDQIGLADNAGTVFIYYGRSRQELDLSSPQRINQFTIGAISEANDGFGAALAAGDVNGDGVEDLVIGAPGEDNGQGAVHVLFGDRIGGLKTTGTRHITQSSPGVAGLSEDGDRFGSAIAIGNFDGVGSAEIAVSAPNEDFGNVVNAGVVNIISVATTSQFSSNIQSASKTTGIQAFGTNASGLIAGNARHNEIYTRAGGDIALGLGGNDYLNAGTGNDLLDGGKGVDTYVGGRGRDIFILKPKSSTDVIKDFRDGVDYVGLAGGLEFEDLRIVQQGSSTVLRANGSRLAVLEGVQSSLITSEDFLPVGFTQIKGFTAPVVLV